MKLTDFLQDVGRPVAYYPELRRITGSTNATILLCQFIYWRGKENDKDGWLYKSSSEIEEETGLSYDEQKTARRNLIDAGLMEEHYARLDHQMKFRLLLDVINEKWGKPNSHIPEHGIATMGKAEIPCSLNELKITTEITTETPEKAPENKQLIDPIDHALSFSKASAKAELALQIESEVKVRLGMEATSTKNGMKFVECAVKKHLQGEDYKIFIDWYFVNVEKKYRSFNSMIEKWPMAFDAPTDPAIRDGVLYA